MLERILNISAGSDYKNSAKPNRYNKNSNFLHVLNSSISDSVSLSPASSFLSSINWRLKRLNKNNDKVLINFEIDGFDFATHVNQSEIQLFTGTDFDVNKIIESDSIRFDLKMIFHTEIKYDRTELIKTLDHLGSLTSFADKLISLSFHQYELSLNSEEVQSLFFSYQYQLKLEFDYINKCLMHFLEKYLSFKLIELKDKKHNDDSFLLKKIRIDKI